MGTTENSHEPKNNKLVYVLMALAAIIAVLSSLNVVQKTLQPYLQKSNRVVLAKISTYYGTEQDHFLILKVKDSFGIQIEIYEVNQQTSSQILKQKFDLVQDSDAYVTIDKNSTNLALSDVDHDGQLDIIAPSVDRNGNLRLNTFRYNANLKNFEPYTETTN